MPLENVFDSVKYKIADLLEQFMGIERASILRGAPLIDLDPDFDSLAMLEILLMLEHEYGVAFDVALNGRNAREPWTADSLAHELVRQKAGSRLAGAH
jgi:acyl carrier protein